MTYTACRAGIFAAVLSAFVAVPALAQDRTSNPGAEGIEVHGDWTIEVYEGDELIERREFENALASGGAEKMFRTLAGLETPSPWGIGIIAEYEKDGTTTSCLLWETFYGGSCYQSTEPSAEAQVPTSGDNAGNLVLQRNFSSESWSMTIREVATGLASCASSVSPDDCEDSHDLAGSIYSITKRTLDTPVTAEAGQQVKIEVVISFTG